MHVTRPAAYLAVGLALALALSELALATEPPH
jgi:hypothetical protein